MAFLKTRGDLRALPKRLKLYARYITSLETVMNIISSCTSDINPINEQFNFEKFLIYVYYFRPCGTNKLFLFRTQRGVVWYDFVLSYGNAFTQHFYGRFPRIKGPRDLWDSYWVNPGCTSSRQVSSHFKELHRTPLR